MNFPIGAEDNLEGIVDLITMEEWVWKGEDLGASWVRGPIRDDLQATAAFLREARKESGNIDQCHNRDPEYVADPDETRTLVRTVNVQTSGLVLGLISHNPNHHPIDPGVTYHHVGSKILHDLEEITPIHELVDHLMNIVGALGI